MDAFAPIIISDETFVFDSDVSSLSSDDMELLEQFLNSSPISSPKASVATVPEGNAQIQAQPQAQAPAQLDLDLQLGLGLQPLADAKVSSDATAYIQALEATQSLFATPTTSTTTTTAITQLDTTMVVDTTLDFNLESLGLASLFGTSPTTSSTTTSAESPVAPAATNAVDLGQSTIDITTTLSPAYPAGEFDFNTLFDNFDSMSVDVVDTIITPTTLAPTIINPTTLTPTTVATLPTFDITAQAPVAVTDFTFSSFQELTLSTTAPTAPIAPTTAPAFIFGGASTSIPLLCPPTISPALLGGAPAFAPTSAPTFAPAFAPVAVSVCAPSPTSTASSLASSPITPASPVSRRRWHITEGRGLRKPLRDPREWFARNPDVGHCHYVVDDDLSLLEGLDGDLGTMPEVGSQNAPIDLTADAKPAALAAVKPKPMVFSFYDGRRESYSAKALYDVPSPRPCRWLPTSEHIFGYVESAGDDAETVKSRVTAMATEMAKARAGKGKGKAKATGMDGEEENASAPLPGAVTFMVYTAADRDYINKGVAPSGGRGGTKKRSGSEATGKSSKRRKSKSSA